jgi:hypothetical protein
MQTRGRRILGPLAIPCDDSQGRCAHELDDSAARCVLRSSIVRLGESHHTVADYPGRRGNHFYGPNSRTWDCGNTFHNFALTSDRSNHSGGVFTLLCDGSVRFVADSINLGIWRAIGSRAGNEVVSEF